MVQNKYKDYTKICFTKEESNEWKSYRIGTNNNQFFTANSILLLASEEFLIRFEKPDNIQIPIHPNRYFHFDGPIDMIYVIPLLKAKNACIEIWAEGRRAHR